LVYDVCFRLDYRGMKSSALPLPSCNVGSPDMINMQRERETTHLLRNVGQRPTLRHVDVFVCCIRFTVK
jgi:hypothetical protein